MKAFLKKKLDTFIKGSYWYNEVAFKDCRKFWEMDDEGFEVINLGSSSGVYDFDYSVLPVKGMNWAVAPQTMVGDFAILQQYKTRLSKGATVIYPLCPFTSISGAEDYVEDRCYTFLNYDRIPNPHYLRLVKMTQMKEDPLPFYPLVSIKLEFARSFSSKRDVNIAMNEQQLKDNAEEILQNWKSQFKLNDLSLPFDGHNKLIYDKGVLLFREIVSFCSDQGLRLIIVVPPMYKTLARLFSSSDRENLIDSFIHKGIGDSVEYYNMMEDDNISSDASYFTNSYFLNKKGAKVYTLSLLKKLNLIS